MIEKGFEIRNQERSKLATVCIELVISWSMWWWWAALSRGCRHISEPHKSLGSCSAVFAYCVFLGSFDPNKMKGVGFKWGHKA